MKNVKFTKEDIVNWCKAHKKELIVGGCASIGAIVSIAIFKGKNKVLEETTSKAEKDLIDYICKANDYRTKYPNILEGYDNSGIGMWFIADYIINAPVDFAEVNGDPDAAFLAINDVVKNITANIDLNDISSIEMLVNLK